MDLGTFVPRENMQGDSFPARDNVDKPLIVLVREHRIGIKTVHNSNPKNPGYKPDGGEGVIVDVADLYANQVFVDALWMNGAVVDNLAPAIGQILPVKLQWQAPASGGNSYIVVTALEGDELNYAGQWAAANDGRFEWERNQRQAAAQAEAAAGDTAAPAPAPAPPAQPQAPQYAPPAAQQYAPPAQPQYAPPAQPQAQQYAPPAQQYAPPAQPQYAPPAAQQYAPPAQAYQPPLPAAPAPQAAAPAPLAAPPTVDGQPLDAGTLALLQQLQAQQAAAAAAGQQ